MKLKLTFAIFAAGAAFCASNAMAAGRWPQIGQDDLYACKAEIGEFHRREIAFLADQATRYCAQEHTTAQECSQYKQEAVQGSINTGDIAWFAKGNGRCEMSDYPCFGPQLYNDTREGPDADHWLKQFYEEASAPATAEAGLNGYYSTVHKCVAQIFVRKYEALNGGGGADDVAGTRVANNGDGMSRMANGDTSGGDTSGGDTSGSNGDGNGNGNDDDVQTAALTPGADGAGTKLPTGPGPNSAACKQAIAADEAEVSAMNAAYPPGAPLPPGVGATAIYKGAMFIMNRRMEVLDAHCKGEPEYAQYAGMKSSRDTARKSCTQLSSDNGSSCVPTKWW